MSISLLKRPRRNRKSPAIRALVREHILSPSHLVMPLFVTEGKGKKEKISSMPGLFRLSPDRIVKECRELAELGLSAAALFPALSRSKKDKLAKESANDKGLYQNTIRLIKKNVPNFAVISDVAMDPYSSDGHDGYVNAKEEIDNDATLPILAKMALSQARAGADIVAPSDMMDGRVRFIRETLDREGFTGVGILSYAAKYASSFYGPFRDALASAPKNGDKKTYQMDPANTKEAVREVLLDIEEGADMVMIKPGLPYLDIVKTVSQIVTVPLAVYNVSGEYAMVHAAADKGWIDLKSTVLEILLSFTRAGANIIFTYHAKEAAKWLRH